MASKLTQVIANFETTLATKLASGAVSGSLTNATDKNGVALPAGKYCMIVDRGTGDEEHLLFDLTGTAMTNIKSVSRQGVQTAGVQNTAGHRVGAKCVLTDFVNLKVIVDILSGQDTLDKDNPLKYDGDPTFNQDQQLVTKKYVADNYVGVNENDVVPANLTFNGNNIHNGQESFTQAPQVPTPTNSGDAVNLAYVLSLVFGGVVSGFNKMTVNYDTLGRVKNVRDNELGKSYIVSYDTQDNPVKIFDGVSTWHLNYSNDRLVSITKP